MSDAWLTSLDGAELAGLNQTGFRTKVAVYGGVSLVLWRDAEMDGTAAAQPATTVLVELRNRLATGETQGAVNMQLQQADLSAIAPWDVRPGDRFTLPDGTSGKVSLVPPARLGVQTALADLEVWR